MAAGEADARHDASDLRQGLGWLVLGIAVLVASLRMDRLQSQGVAAYAAPGLLPGLLGLATILFGTLLTWRGWRARDTRDRAAPQPGSARLALVLALCLVFGLGLVGHGLPFWAAAALFVMASILVLRRADGAVLTARRVASAVLIGLGAGLGATLVFQELFLVRLP